MPCSITYKSRLSVFIALFSIIIIFNFSCQKELANVPSSQGIISFSLLEDSIVNVDAKVTITNDSVKITIPGTTNLAGLVPKITLQTGATISPASGIQQNFSQPVIYTVTSATGVKKSYVVVVTLDKLKSIVYFGGGNSAFYALDGTTGSLIWDHTSNGSFSYSSPAFYDNTIYAGSGDNNMYAYDAALGNLKWQFTAGSFIESSPAVVDGMIYFGSDDHYFYALEAATGALKWKFQTGFNVSSSPALLNGIVYFGSDDSNFYAVDAKTGNIVWKYYVGNFFNASSPVIANNTVFIGNRDGYLYAFDASSGSIKWQFSANNISLEMARPVIVNGVIYLSGWYNFNNFKLAGSVYAVNEATGALIWKSLDNIGFSSGAVVADGKLFISGDDGNVYALDSTTGSIIWKNSILPNGAIPAVKNGIVYVGGGGTGYFYALDESTGSVKWKYAVPQSLNMSKPYVIDANGN